PAVQVLLAAVHLLRFVVHVPLSVVHCERLRCNSARSVVMMAMSLPHCRKLSVHVVLS
ncbi:hypothetical protein DFQ26_003113, partial [Actinomortierella ambigua]